MASSPLLQCARTPSKHRRHSEPSSVTKTAASKKCDILSEAVPASRLNIANIKKMRYILPLASAAAAWQPACAPLHRRATRRSASAPLPVDDPPTLEEQLELAEGENAYLRRRLAQLESRLREQPHPPLWALEDWASIDGVEGCRELGRDRLGTALQLYNAAHPKKTPLRTDGSMEQLAREVVAVLPALKQAVVTKRKHAQSKRVLQAATKSGHIRPGHVVEGVVAAVRAVGVLVDIPTPFGTYRAQLKPDQVTGVTRTPLQSFVAEAFPVGSHVLAEVLDVDAASEVTACHLSTRNLEEALGEMSTDRDALFARARARRAAQPPPRSRAERREVAKAAEHGLAEPYIEALEHHHVRAG